ncbi:MAG: response regulator, partial [Caldilineae bacterium]
VWKGNIINRRKDGHLFTVETIIIPILDEGGTITHYAGIQRDVTRELLLEEQNRQAQKMEAVGQLTAGIAHDFNNILTAINGYAELLQMRLANDQTAQRMLGQILISGKRAADLVSQLLAFGRKAIIRPKILDLSLVIADLDKMLRRVIGEDIEIKTQFQPHLWAVKMDPSQVEQVVVNLAVNARDAMPRGGTLTIELKNVTLDKTYADEHIEVEPGDYVLLAVTDTGTGMPPEVMEHIFEPFFTTKEVGKGSGLGLSTVFGIVKQNDGHIRVYSEEGKGTTFKIYLPAVGVAPPPAPKEEKRTEVRGGTETILLVEDEPQVRKLAFNTLTAQGYTVLDAPDGEAALKTAQTYTGPIHLLLTDVIMPRMGGKELAKRLKALRPDVRVLYTSGYTSNAIVHHGVLEPGLAFLEKPFSARALLRKVRQVLDAQEEG